MNTTSNDEPSNAGAKPTIKFRDLTPAQQQKVRDRARRAIVNSAAHKNYWEAFRAARDASDAELIRLDNEPLTTGALFIVAGAFLDFLDGVVAQIGNVQRAEQDGLSETDDPGYLQDGPSPTARRLVAAYLQGRESPYWDADSAQWETRHALDNEEARILDETATQMFGVAAK